jgi:hypothetical protein
MFQLQITVQSIEEAERLLACLKHSADPAAVKEVEEQIPFHSPGGLSDDESPAKKYFPQTTNTAGEPAVEKPKNPRGRPRRQVADPLPESAAPVVASEDSLPLTGADPSVPAQQTYSQDDVRAALMGVRDKTPGDMTKCLAILQKFGAQRVVEIKPEDFAKFIAACKAA